MKEARFLKSERPEWARLEGFASRLNRLAPKELLEFVALYRRATSDLARARTLKVRNEVVDYLNGLVGRIHFQIYTTPQHSWRFVADFFAQTLPRTVRANGGFVLASLLFLVLPALGAYVAVAINPDLIRVLVPGFADQIDQYATVGQRGAGVMAFMNSFYIYNNVQVSFLSFVGGLPLGLGSIFVLVTNGAMVGATLSAVANAGASRPFVTFISAHGGIELFAFVLSAAAGLRLGATLFNPGDLRRIDAMKAAGRDAGIIMFGVIAMLCVAAMIEAWVSPSRFPDPLKWVAGIVNIGLVAAYFTRVGRPRGSAAP